MKRGLAAGQRGRHHQVFGSGDGNLFKLDLAADQTAPLRRPRHHVACFQSNLGAEMLKGRKMKVNWPRTDSTAARQ